MTHIWRSISGIDLMQGDILDYCAIALVPDGFSLASDSNEIQVETRRLIVMTQSCDLSNNKSTYAALCPVFTLPELQQVNPRLAQRGKWEEIRRAKIEGLYMLPSVTDPAINRDALVVDFRMIVSLPIGYLSRHAGELVGRPRLQSPYVEHFSQSFARFFMRVGLPSQIPEFTA